MNVLSTCAPPMVETLEYWCDLANAAAFELDGVRNTCISTSLALAEFLRLQGFDAEVFRATAGVRCVTHERGCHGSVAGSDGDGSRRPKSVNWNGHLAVSCGSFVLDPTIDQLNVDCGLRPMPAAFVKPEGWDVPDNQWSGGASYSWREGDLHVRHRRHRRQVGWKSKPAARRSHWMPVVSVMLEGMIAHYQPESV